VLFTAEGDMRQALNNLQSTHAGYGFVNRENVFKVRTQQHTPRPQWLRLTILVVLL
jgi:replication factor C subunit 2/4